MNIIVKATFENGAFKPTQPVNLAEGALVRSAISAVGGDFDPWDNVIAVCHEGPEISLAEQHDALR